MTGRIRSRGFLCLVVWAASGPVSGCGRDTDYPITGRVCTKVGIAGGSFIQSAIDRRYPPVSGATVYLAFDPYTRKLVPGTRVTSSPEGYYRIETKDLPPQPTSSTVSITLSSRRKATSAWSVGSFSGGVRNS